MLVVTGAALVAFWISLQHRPPVLRVYYLHPYIDIQHFDLTCEVEVESWLKERGFRATSDVPGSVEKKLGYEGARPFGQPAFYSAKYRGVDQMYVRVQYLGNDPEDNTGNRHRICALVIGTERSCSSLRDENEWDEKIRPVAEQFAFEMTNWMERRFNDPEFPLLVHSPPKKRPAIKP